MLDTKVYIDLITKREGNNYAAYLGPICTPAESWENGHIMQIQSGMIVAPRAWCSNSVYQCIQILHVVWFSDTKVDIDLGIKCEGKQSCIIFGIHLHKCSGYMRVLYIEFDTHVYMQCLFNATAVGRCNLMLAWWHLCFATVEGICDLKPN